jgi:hypothetical protein
MAIEFTDQLTFNFDPTSGQVQALTIRTPPFRGNVVRAQAMLKGFDIRYTNGDHHVLREEIDLDVSLDPAHPNTVLVQANFLLRDSSGNIDDPFAGRVEAVVIAQTTAA